MKSLQRQKSNQRLDQVIPSIREIDLFLAKKSLRDFVHLLWTYADPHPFISNWHIDAICDHLEAMSRGEIRRLIINVPPRFTKSLLVSVHWPMWDWLNEPSRQFMAFSYAASLTVRDNVRSRNIFLSHLYQTILAQHGMRLDMAESQATKVKFQNSEGGYKIASSVGGTGTGDGGDFLIIDDPHNVTQGESKQVREGVIQWWREVLPSRLHDAQKGGIVVVMQRCHEKDLVGDTLEREGKEWDQLILPMRYEKVSRVRSSIGFEDPRTVEGELLCERRFNTEETKRLEQRLGTYGTASQLQQSPVPRKGGLFDITNFRIITPEQLVKQHIEESVRYWDKAGTDGGGAYSAGVLMHRMRKTSPFQFVISDVVRGQWSYAKREQVILDTATKDEEEYGRFAVEVGLEQEPGSGGKESAERTMKELRGHKVYKETVSNKGDKEQRAEPLSAQVEIGNVAIVAAPWNKEFLDEMRMFPRGKYRDQTDGTSGGFNRLTRLNKVTPSATAGVFGRRK